MKEWEREVSMRCTLRSAPAVRFSEIAVLRGRRAARPRPRHHHARRDVAGRARAGPPRLAVGRRRHPDHAREGAAERPEAREPDVQADLRHGALRLAQQRHRPLQPAPLQVPVRRLPKRPLERADEVGLRGQRDPGQRRHVERLVVGAVHLVASPQHAAAGGIDPDHVCDPTAVRRAAPRAPLPRSSRVPRAAGGPVDLDRDGLRGGSRFDELERCVWAGGGEQPRALADDDGIGEQDELVDELVVEQAAYEVTAAVHLQLAARPGLQLADGGREASGEDARFRPPWLGERGRRDVLGARVQRRRDRVVSLICAPGAGSPGAGEDLVRHPAEQEGVGALEHRAEERLGLAAEERQRPSATLEPAPAVLVGPAEALHHAVDGEVRDGSQLHDGWSFLAIWQRKTTPMRTVPSGRARGAKKDRSAASTVARPECRTAAATGPAGSWAATASSSLSKWTSKEMSVVATVANPAASSAPRASTASARSSLLRSGTSSGGASGLISPALSACSGPAPTVTTARPAGAVTRAISASARRGSAA